VVPKGQTEAKSRRSAMSALVAKADINRRDGNVRLVPKADICSAAKNAPLFDHLISEQCRHNFESERLRSFETTTNSA